MKAGIIAFSDRGELLARKIGQLEFIACRPQRCPKGGLGSWVEQNFYVCDALLFIGAAGIAVRAIAPFVKSKVSDPAVLAIDELGRYVIPLLSGHIGGANLLAQRIAKAIGSTAVITTATDINGVFAFDSWAAENGMYVDNPPAIKSVSSKLLSGGTAGLCSGFPLSGPLPRGVRLCGEDSCDVLITYRTGRGPLRLIPRVLTLGVGCRRGTDRDALDAALNTLLKSHDIHPMAIRAVFSIDIKADEPGLAEFCALRSLPFITYSARQLASVEGEFSSSRFVQSVTGVDNVCERAAVLGSKSGRLLVKKTVYDGVTLALAQDEYTITF